MVFPVGLYFASWRVLQRNFGMFWFWQCLIMALIAQLLLSLPRWNCVFFFLIVFFPFLCSASLGFVHCNFAEKKTGSLAVLATFLALPRLPKILPMWEGFCGCVVWSCMPMLRQHLNYQTYLEPFWIRRFVWFSILDKKASRLTGSGNMVACK